MKRNNHHTIIALLSIFIMFGTTSVIAQQDIVFQEDGIDGFSILRSGDDAITLRHTISRINLNELTLKGVFIPSAPQSPNLPTNSRFLAFPNGASPIMKITSCHEKIFEDIDIPPAIKIQMDLDEEEPQSTKNQDVYGKNAFYPENPFLLSETTMIRGLNVALLSVTPFQYNPVTKQLKVFYDIKIEIIFGKNDGIYGDQRYRSPQWDKLLSDMILNYESLPGFDFYERINKKKDNLTGCEYLIVIPDNENFINIADSLRRFRNEQGILTQVVNLKEIGYNTPDSLRSYFKKIYKTWDIVPSAILLFGDYDTDIHKGIVSFKMWDHPAGYEYEPYLSDNKLVDFNGDDLPEIVISRLPAADKDQAELMVNKTIQYETNPASDSGYYAHPVTAMGFQLKLWFQLCSEVIGGYFRSIGKEPTRLNDIYEGTPGDIWSTGQNTESVISYFGPEGLGYIPASMSHLTSWNASSADISDAINKGCFIVQHRDHGYYQGWGEPSYNNNNINQLTNKDLCFVMSNNCQTGDFIYGSGSNDCFAERLLRVEHGAVGVIAASEASYSYVNDTYTWGYYDYLFPDFMPSYGTDNQAFQRTAFANTAGKYFLQQSSWPYNTSFKKVTYHLFHHFGDAYLQLYSEVPQYLAVSHPDSITSYTDSIYIKADANSLIALSFDGKLLAAKEGTGEDELFLIPEKTRASRIKVTVTKQNHYRYTDYIYVANEINFDELNKDFSVYPNPVRDDLVIENVRFSSIVIYNVLGQKVFESESNFEKIEQLHINFSGWGNGTYILMIESDNQDIIKSIIHIK